MDTSDTGYRRTAARALDMLLDGDPTDDVAAYLFRETVAEARRSIRQYGPDRQSETRK